MKKILSIALLCLFFTSCAELNNSLHSLNSGLSSITGKKSNRDPNIIESEKNYLLKMVGNKLVKEKIIDKQTLYLVKGGFLSNEAMLYSLFTSPDKQLMSSDMYAVMKPGQYAQFVQTMDGKSNIYVKKSTNGIPYYIGKDNEGHSIWVYRYYANQKIAKISGYSSRNKDIDSKNERKIVTKLYN